MLKDALEMVAGGGHDMSVARSLRAQANSAHRADADNYVPEVAGTLDRGIPARGGAAGYYDQMIPTTVGTLSDGAHNGGGLTAKMPTPGAYLPSVANPLTARMGKGINTTLDEVQTAIVEGRDDL